MRNLLLMLAVCAVVGCASTRIEQTEIAPDGTRRETSFRGRTFFDSKSELARAKTTMTDKSQSVDVSGLSQSASGTNATALVEGVVKAAVSAAVKSVVPVP